MQQPKGIAVVLGVLFGLVVVGAVIGGVLLFRGESKTQTPVANTNAALQLACSNDADCISYCGGDPNYQPICGVTSIGAAGTCTCRSTSGPTVPSGNTNATTNANANGNTNGNANVNASTNVNTNSTVSTTSWKTYANTQYKYSLLYPSDWAVDVTIEQLEGTIKPENQVTFEKAHAFFSVFVGDVDINNSNVVSATTLDLAGEKAVKYVEKNTANPSSPDVERYVFSTPPFPNRTVRNYIVLQPAQESDMNTLRTILSTFSFTK